MIFKDIKCNFCGLNGLCVYIRCLYITTYVKYVIRQRNEKDKIRNRRKDDKQIDI